MYHEGATPRARAGHAGMGGAWNGELACAHVEHGNVQTLRRQQARCTVGSCVYRGVARVRRESRRAPEAEPEFPSPTAHAGAEAGAGAPKMCGHGGPRLCLIFLNVCEVRVSLPYGVCALLVREAALLLARVEAIDAVLLTRPGRALLARHAVVQALEVLVVLCDDKKLLFTTP